MSDLFFAEINQCRNKFYKEIASNIKYELNVKFWSNNTEIVFSCKIYYNNSFICNFEKYFTV